MAMTLLHMKRERGAALLTAMIIVTLVATLAAAMVWQQWRAVQVETAERARTQAAWILTGALDWARLILREDARNAGADHLGEPWAVPLAEARLSTFLAADKDNNADDAPEAFLSGSIVDAQARYNLRNLCDAAGKPIEDEVAALRRLFESTGVAPDLAARIATGLHDAIVGGANAPLMPQTVAQLNWLGVDDDSVRLMAQTVVMLPVPTAINFNTAPREVLAAVVPTLDLGSAERLVQARQRNHFKSTAEFLTLMPSGAQLAAAKILEKNTNRYGTSSNFFEVHGRLRLGDRVLEESSLVERKPGLEVVALSRVRENSRGFGG
jgi:general secretion pathway protein K